MARLWATGFELQTATVGYEWITGQNGSPAIETTTKRSGAAALRINNSASAENIIHEFRSTQGACYTRVYIYVVAAPTSDRPFITFYNSSNNKLSVRMLSGANARKLRFYNEEDLAQIGSDSTALSLNTWYRIEIKIDDTTLASTTVEARAFAASDESTEIWNTSGTVDLTANPNRLRLGTNTADATFDMIFDDVAINDASGSYENSWPGEGELILLKPNGNGASSQWTGSDGNSTDNYLLVDETSPDDATSYVESNTSGHVDDYDVEATPAALESTDTIKWVGVGVRFALSSTTGGDPDFVLRIKDGSNVDETGNLSGAGSTAYVSFQTATPRNYPVFANSSNYERPGTASLWTKSTLDTMQVGIRESVTDTHFLRVSTVWVYVEHKPAGAQSYTLTAELGTFTETGVATSLEFGRLLSATVQTYTETGVSNTLSLAHKVIGEVQTYSVTGVNNSFIYHHVISANIGSYSISGIDSNLEFGRIFSIDTGTFAITGISSTLSTQKKISADLGTFSITGISNSLLKTSLLSANVGTYSISGVDAVFRIGKIILASLGTFTISGVDASLKTDKKIVPDVGSFSITGVASSLFFGKRMATDVGIFSVTGVNVSTLYNRLLSASLGTIAVSGVSASLLFKRILTAGLGTYSISGVSAGLLVSRLLSAGLGTFTINGIDVTLIHGGAGGYTIVANTGVFTETGLNVSLLFDRLLSPTVGAYTLTGNAVNLTKAITLITSAGSFVITGIDTSYLYNRLITAGLGVFSETGISTSLVYDRLLATSIGTFSINGVNVNFLKGVGFIADTGNFVVTGQNVGFSRIYVITANNGTFTISTVPASLIYRPSYPQVAPHPARTYTLTESTRTDRTSRSGTIRVTARNK